MHCCELLISNCLFAFSVLLELREEVNVTTFKSHQYILGFQGTMSKGLKQTEVSLSFSDNLQILSYLVISYLTGYMICQKNKFDKN